MPDALSFPPRLRYADAGWSVIPAWIVLATGSGGLLAALPAAPVDPGIRMVAALYGAIALAGLLLGLTVSTRWAILALAALATIDIVHYALQTPWPPMTTEPLHAAAAILAIVLLGPVRWVSMWLTRPPRSSGR